MPLPLDTVATERVLDEVADLYGQGKYLQAYKAGHAALGELSQWQGTKARLWAGRLASNLGAPRLGAVLHQLAWRADKTDPWARFFYITALLRRRDPLFALQRMEQFGDLDGATEKLRADWFALRAYLLACLRDFEQADVAFRRAEELAPDRSWIWVERSAILAEQDLHEEALQVAQKAFDLRPWYRPAVQQKVAALIHLNRDQEALQLLSEAAARCESGSLVAQLASFQTELELYADARQNFDRVAQFYPLMDKEGAEWLAARRSDAAYHCFDFPAAADLARQVHESFFARMQHLPASSRRWRHRWPAGQIHRAEFCERIAQRLGDIAQRLGDPALNGKREKLAVPYVRQHFVTCAPATLTAVSLFWKRPAQHLEIAEEICYDGTPAHSQRTWAENNGWIAREFTVTWDSAVALIDRGVPFTLTITYTGMAHLQAIFGYDSRRKTLLIRDPTERMFLEYEAEQFFEREAPNGPRGMALVPADRPELIADLALPDEPLYDRLHALSDALKKHDRATAQAMLDEMQGIDARHRLTLRAQVELAHYDDDVTALLGATERLLEQYPADENLHRHRLACLRQLGRRDDRLEILRGICGGEDPDPLFFQELAEELLVDARQHDAAEWAIRRAIRWRPEQGESYSVLGRLRWGDHVRHEALELYRYAACLEEHREWFAETYFLASRHLMQSDVALRFLKDRFHRFGHRSSLPARTLTRAFDALHQHGEAEEVLQSALKLHERDGELQLFTADYYARYGDFERAEQLLGEAKPNCRAALWLRGAAEIASYRGDMAGALVQWREILALEPLALDAHDAVSRLLFLVEGYEATLAHVRQAVAQFPKNYVLHQMLIEWLRQSDPAETEKAVRELLAIQSVDPWARRELAISLYEQGRLADGFAEARQAQELEPHNPAVHLILGLLYRKGGDTEEAKESFRQAIRLSVDYGIAIQELLATCDSKAQRADELRFVRRELLKQVILGDAVLGFCDCAATTLEPDELLDTLREILAARPDLWQAWSTTIDQLITCERVSEALDVAKQSSDRFPLLPIVWLDLAKVHHERGEFAEQIAAIERALDISPGMSYASRQLAEAYEHQGDLERARQVLEAAIARDPASPGNHNFLAEILWNLRRRDEALEKIRHAVRLAPADNDWAWRTYRAWCQELGRRDQAISLAREFTHSRRNVAQVWLVLASLLDAPDERAEAMAALNRALELDPRNIEAHGRRADLLLAEGRIDEALAACRPATFVEGPPLVLRARGAAILAEKGDLPGAIAQMQQVVDDDSEYLYAWAQLAEWYHRTGQDKLCADASGQLVRLVTADADWQAWTSTVHHLVDVGQAEQGLGLAQKAVARFPAHPYVWLTMGYVQHVRGDEAGEVAALERALDVDPRCGDAARYLAETYNRQGNLPRCREVLEKSLAADPDNAVTRGYLAETLWNLGDRAAALENIQHAIRLAPDEDWSWNALRHWAREAAQIDPTLAEVPARFARELAESRPTDAAAWVALAGVLDGHERRSEAHAALDRAVSIDPRNISAHMQRATLLAEDEQFDAAVVACHPPVFGERPPTPLLMHAADIEAQRGNLVAAVAQLQDVVLDEPEFFWGWKRLADLYEIARDWENYVQAAEQMARIEPQEPSCWGYLADARLHVEDRAGAKRDLQRAIELAPDYPFAVNMLLELHLEDGDLEAAAKTLDRAAPYMPPALSAAQQVRVASRRKDEAAAVEHFRTLCMAPSLGVEPFYGAIDEMLDAGWQETVDRELASAVSQQSGSPTAPPHGVTPQLGAVWVEWCASHNRFDRCLEALTAFRGEKSSAIAPVWFAAAESYVNELADAKQAQPLQSFLDAACDDLRQEPRTWAAVGNALAQLGLVKDAVLWLADWRERPGVQPYMLVALVGSLWELGREDEAAEVSVLALGLPVDDSAKAVHALWLALHSVVEGKPGEALPLLAQLVPDLFSSDFYAALCTLVSALAEIQVAPTLGGRPSYAEARSRLQDAIIPFREQIAGAKLLRRIVFRCLATLAGQYGHRLAALWWKVRAKLA